MVTTSKAKPYFGYVPKILFENMEMNNLFVIRWYNDNKAVRSKTMKGYLLFALD